MAPTYSKTATKEVSASHTSQTRYITLILIEFAQHHLKKRSGGSSSQ